MKRLDLITIIALNIVGMLFVGIVVAEAYLSVELNDSFFVLQIAWTFLIGMWVMVDAARKPVTIGVLGAMAFFQFPSAFFIYYCFKSRGRNGLALCLWGIGGFVAYGGAATAVQLARL